MKNTIKKLPTLTGTLVLAASVSLMATSANAQNLLLNPSFEDVTPFPASGSETALNPGQTSANWTAVNGTVGFMNNIGNRLGFDGDISVSLNNAEGLEQNVSVTTGTVYKVCSRVASFTDGTASTAAIFIDNTNVTSAFSAGSGYNDYELMEGTFTAASNNVTFRIQGTSSNTAAQVDLVYLGTGTQCPASAGGDDASGPPSADISIEKVLDANVTCGSGQSGWSATVSNAGPSDATGIVVTDVPTNGGSVTAFPSGCTSSDTSAGTCNVADIPGGSSAVVTICTTP